ncbi:MAG TPA: PEP-CTERM sorting domain-containing protein [Phycisphaerae bacterium]|nr:PEP-CTERM sorting domain-containing protein [Phycisphaerae bacterium]
MKTLSLVGVVCALMLSTAAQAEIVTVSPDFDVRLGVTSIYKTQIGGTISTVRITTPDDGGGASGIFTGLDVDFVILDKDGDLSTVEDQILPTIDPAVTYVIPGEVFDAAGSIYQPSESNPGVRFGLNAKSQIEWGIATLAQHDAYYIKEDLVNTAQGWVTLGIEGVLVVEFDMLFAEEGAYWLCIGDVGKPQEQPSAAVSVEGPNDIPEPTTLFLLSAAGIFLLKRRKTA